MCPAGSVVACWSLTQEVAGWQVRVLLMSIFFVAEIAEFSEKHLGKTPVGKNYCVNYSVNNGLTVLNRRIHTNDSSSLFVFVRLFFHLLHFC